MARRISLSPLLGILAVTVVPAVSHAEGLVPTHRIPAELASQAVAEAVASCAKQGYADLEALYGLDKPRTEKFGRRCLMARRLVERGVRMVQVYYGNGQPWDNHDDIMIHRKLAATADKPIAALLKDLKSRGLLQDTIVLIGGEFGRTPAVETSGLVKVQNGRDHNSHGYSMLLAGGGVKGGITYGATDDFGFKAVDKPVHPHDLHATILHLLGMDHTKLTYRYSGRDFRLTDVAGEVVKGILA